MTSTDPTSFVTRGVAALVSSALVLSMSLPANASMIGEPPVDDGVATDSTTTDPVSDDAQPSDTGETGDTSDTSDPPVDTTPDDPPPPDPEPDPEPPPPSGTPTATVGPDADYETFRNSLPSDFDINYVFVPTQETRARKNRRQVTEPLTPKKKKGLRTAGSAIMTLGILGGVGMLAGGAISVASAKDDLPSKNSSTVPSESQLKAQQEAIEKGQRGNTLIIAGSATAGGAFALGLPLLLIGRQQYTAADAARSRGGGAPILSSKSRRSVSTMTAVSLVGGGTMFLLGALSESDSTKRSLYIGGGALMGVGALLGIILIVDKAKQGASVQVGPMLTKTTSGAQLSMKF